MGHFSMLQGKRSGTGLFLQYKTLLAENKEKSVSHPYVDMLPILTREAPDGLQLLPEEGVRAMFRSKGSSNYTGPHWEHLVSLPKGDPARGKGAETHSLET